MVSAIDRAKRALVTLVKQMAVLYRVTINIDRDSDDGAVRSAYRKVSMKSHPDKGGREEHQKKLGEAYDTWQQEIKDRAGKRGNKRPETNSDLGVVVSVRQGREDKVQALGFGRRPCS